MCARNALELLQPLEKVVQRVRLALLHVGLRVCRVSLAFALGRKQAGCDVYLRLLRGENAEELVQVYHDLFARGLDVILKLRYEFLCACVRPAGCQSNRTAERGSER